MPWFLHRSCATLYRSVSPNQKRFLQPGTQHLQRRSSAPACRVQVSRCCLAVTLGMSTHSVHRVTACRWWRSLLPQRAAAPMCWRGSPHPHAHSKHHCFSGVAPAGNACSRGNLGWYLRRKSQNFRAARAFHKHQPPALHSQRGGCLCVSVGRGGGACWLSFPLPQPGHRGKKVGQPGLEPATIRSGDGKMDVRKKLESDPLMGCKHIFGCHLPPRAVRPCLLTLGGGFFPTSFQSPCPGRD